MEYATTPGERLKRIRHTLGLSQEELADRIDYEKAALETPSAEGRDCQIT